MFQVLDNYVWNLLPQLVKEVSAANELFSFSFFHYLSIHSLFRKRCYYSTIKTQQTSNNYDNIQQLVILLVMFLVSSKWHTADSKPLLMPGVSFETHLNKELCCISIIVNVNAKHPSELQSRDLIQGLQQVFADAYQSKHIEKKKAWKISPKTCDL